MGGSLKLEEINALFFNPLLKNIKYFVETGTYMGETVFMLSSLFKKLYTIEIHKELYNNAKKQAEEKSINNIEFIEGDSLEKLDEICSKVEEGAIFFIDAHISGNDSSWNGKNRVPIFEELDIILKYDLGLSVFIIDDLRLWKSEIWDWKHVSNNKILQKFVNNNFKIISFYEKEDRFYIIVNKNK